MRRSNHDENLVFQSEKHPLVTLDFETEEKYCLSLIHQKAYHNAASFAVDRDVLDVGCNIGYGTKIIADRARSIIGVDVAEHSIQAASTQNAAANARYMLVTGNNLPLADDSFDLVTSFQVIEHVRDVQNYLLEIKRVLKPGGMVIFTTPNRVIRLDPGMKPWNAFHVTEYNAEGLREIVGTVFPDVEVQGLFATPGFYAIEFDRCLRKKLAARSRIRMAQRFARRTRARLFDAVKAILPEDTVTKIRSQVRRVEGRASTGRPDEKSGPERTVRKSSWRWSLDDLFYRDEGLDEALDLIAIARMSR